MHKHHDSEASGADRAGVLADSDSGTNIVRLNNRTQALQKLCNFVFSKSMMLAGSHTCFQVPLSCSPYPVNRIVRETPTTLINRAELQASPTRARILHEGYWQKAKDC